MENDLQQLVKELADRGAGEETKSHASEALALLQSLQAAAQPPKQVAHAPNAVSPRVSGAERSQPRASVQIEKASHRATQPAQQDNRPKRFEESLREGSELLALVENKNDQLRKFIMLRENPIPKQATAASATAAAPIPSESSTRAEMPNEVNRPLLVPKPAKIQAGVQVPIPVQGQVRPVVGQIQQRFVKNSFQPLNLPMAPRQLVSPEQLTSPRMPQQVLDIEMRQARIKLLDHQNNQQVYLQSEHQLPTMRAGFLGQAPEAHAGLDGFSLVGDDGIPDRTYFITNDFDRAPGIKGSNGPAPPLAPEEVVARKHFASMLLQRNDFSQAIEDGSALAV